MNRIAVTLLATVLALPLLAQEITFSGKCEDGEDVCYYCPGYDYVLASPPPRLLGSNVNLAPFAGKQVRGTGIWNGSTTAPVITVTSIQAVEQTFSIGGSATIGKKISFTAIGNPGDFAAIALSLVDGFIPVPGYGAVLLNSQSMFVLGQGTVDGGGEFDITFDIPNDPALVGLNLFGQAVTVGPSGVPMLTNNDLNTIEFDN